MEIGLNTAKCTIQKHQNLKWETLCADDPRAQLSKRASWKKEKDLTRRQQIVLSQLRAGGKSPILQRYLHDIGAADSPICKSCGLEAEDAEHLICKCPAHARQRLHYLGNNTTLECLLDKPSGVVGFLEKIGRI